MQTPRRVLVLSASSGAGHVRAAQALEKAFAARGDCAVEHVDALGYTSKLFQKIYDNALTVSEALARGLPMALIEPIPGQEERNGDHLLEHGAAIRCNNLPAAAWKIAKLLDDPARLQRMRAAARAMARPRAASKVVAESLKLMEEK